MDVAETFVEDFLEHHGVKGMKWGVRRSQAALDRAAGRKARKQMNRETKTREKEQRAKKVQSARDKLESGRAARRLDKARSNHKQNKIDLGSRAAKQILNREKEIYNDTWKTASQAKNGKEKAAQVVLSTVYAGMTLAAIYAIANN